MSTNYVGNVQAVQTPISTDYTNLMINGGMAIDQRYEGGSTPSIYVPLSTTVNQYGTDRNIWSASKQASGTQGVSDRIITQRILLTSLTAPIPTEMLNLSHALRFNFEVDSAGFGGVNIFRAGGSGKEVYFSQLIENTIYAGLGWGKTGAKSITLSFWYMTETANPLINYMPFNIFVKNQADTHIYRATVLSGAKNVWKKAIVSIPAPPAGSDWTGYMRVGVCMYDRTATSTVADVWDTTSTSYGLPTTNGVNLFLTGVDTVGDENAWFHITGLQVQEGGATPFEYRPIFKEQELCERYYQKSYNGVVAGTNTNTGTFAYTTTRTATLGNQYTIYYITVMRNTPNVVIYSATGASGNVREAGTTDRPVIVENPSAKNTQFYINSAVSAVGNAIRGHYVANAEFI